MFNHSKVALYSFILWLVSIGSFLILTTNPETTVIKQTFFAKKTEKIVIKKSYLPDYVRGIYLTAWSAGNDEFRQHILDHLVDSKINTVIIDIKDYSGYILYDSQIEAVQNIKAKNNRIHDLGQVLNEFHQQNIYVIARQTVFQDPALARLRPDLALKTYNGNIWYDNKNLAWMDPAQQEVWEYNLAIAQEAINLGFDEINFDYMRYPSDGNMTNLNYNLPEGKTKTDIMKGFFKFLSDNLSAQTPISIDTFGLVLDNTKNGYDLNIGQRLVDMVDYFDYISPMMYPSHYPLTYLGFTNSAEHPGAVISYGLDISSSTMSDKRATLRPWLQAFNIGAIYDQNKIDAQTSATEKASTTNGWLLWNARNYYPGYIFKK